MKPFSLDHLTPTEFENFCFDLLSELGYSNISWRKGTGLASSPSDNGRDIECQRELVDVDGSKYFEKWFVECKHYIEGVPPTKLQGIISWANAKNPDRVLIIASNFLSNPSKEYLEDFERENRPKYKITYWEKPHLERLTLGKSQLLKKYKVSGDFPFVAVLHPAHLLYMKGLQFNSIRYLFECLDSLDAKKRDEILSWAYEAIIKPRYRKSTNKKETLRDLRIDAVSYDAFKKKCSQIVKEDSIDQIWLVFLIVNITLSGLISIGDTTSVDEVVDRMKSFTNFMQLLIDDELTLDEMDIDFDAKGVTSDKDSMRKMLSLMQERIPKVQSETQKHYELYEYFCENVVARLLQENLFENYGRERLKRKYPPQKPA